jgi:hypothetical protein
VIDFSHQIVSRLIVCCTPFSADEAASDAATTVTAVLGAAFGAGVPPWFSVEAIMSANIRLQLAFLSSLFRVAPGLDYDSASGVAEPDTSTPLATSKGNIHPLLL